MQTAALDEVMRLAEQLDPLDQVRLIEHLAPRIARAIAGIGPGKLDRPASGEDAWIEFLRVGEELADQDRPDTETLTAAVLASRR
jgi:hypothetical protein